MIATSRAEAEVKVDEYLDKMEDGWMMHEESEAA